MEIDKNVRVNIIDNKKEKPVVHWTPPTIGEFITSLWLLVYPYLTSLAISIAILWLIHTTFYFALVFGTWVLAVNAALFLLVWMAVCSFIFLKRNQDEILAESKKKEDGGNY